LIDWIELWTEDGSGSLYHQPTTMEQMLELLKAMQERTETQLASLASKMDADQEERKAEMKAYQEETKTLVLRMDMHQQKTDAWIADMRAWRKEITACQEATEAYPARVEASPEEKESVAEHQEVPMEEATVKSSGLLKKRHRDRHLAAGCCG
jgi:hypothetical protein